MIRTIRSIISHKNPLYRYLCVNTRGTRAVRNAANFLIRSTFTGLEKEPAQRTQNERDVLERVEKGVAAINLAKENAFLSAVSRGRRQGGLPAEAAVHRALVRLQHPAVMPDRKSRMLSYELIDGILKSENDPAYYSCTPQVNQQAIRKTVSAWKGYFASLKDWKSHPEKYREMPKIPGYIRSEGATAHFTNQVCRFSKKERNGRVCLEFTNYPEAVPFAGRELLAGKLVKTEVKPWYGAMLLLVTMEDDRKEPEVPRYPERAMGIDPGLGNFMTCVTNTGAAPLLIGGGWIRSRNQWFNREKARLLSALTHGKDSRHSVKHSRALDALSRKRETMLREFFYKTAHRICRFCVSEQIEVIVCGHNEGQKDGISLGHVTNQSFVTIPFPDFFLKLKTVAAGYGIPVVIREESYTSKANVLNGDPIPAYGEKGAEETVFSGKRVYRGKYVTDSGIVLNADVNAAANILRKEYPDIFAGKDLAYLSGTVNVLKGEEILGILSRARRKYPVNRKTEAAEKQHRTRMKNRRKLKQAFAA